MNPEQLAAIRQRAENATPGPWEADRPQVWGPNDESVAFVHHHDPGAGSGQPEWEANAVFIANARTDIPALLDRVDWLTKALTVARRLRDKLTHINSNLTARLAAVRELHTLHTDHRDHQWCHHCETPWPCPTIQAIGGTN